MATALVCIHPFHGHAKGAMITDPQKIEEILASDKAHRFNKINLPESPRPPASIPVEK